MSKQEPAMPFSGENPDELARVLKRISEDKLSVELFDVFLHEYKSGKGLLHSLGSALYEWDS